MTMLEEPPRKRELTEVEQQIERTANHASELASLADDLLVSAVGAEDASEVDQEEVRAFLNEYENLKASVDAWEVEME